MKKYFFYIVLVFQLLTTGAKGTHIIGGELYYTHLIGNNYEVTLYVYRDCAPGNTNFDGVANITVFDQGTSLFKLENVPLFSQTNIPADIYDSCFSVPTGVCVEQAIYRTTLTLPPSQSGYTISWQRCCRNGTIKNITVPGDWGSTIWTTIPPSSTVSSNSSPQFKNRPPAAICLGSDFNFDHSATDIDGDSLVYELCEIYHGGGKSLTNPTGPNGPVPAQSTAPPYSNVTWQTGYTALDPIDALVPFKVDSNTGVFSGTPLSTGQYVYGICTKEYRNGVLLGETRREFQVNVVICIPATRADMLLPGECQGLDLTFNNNSINSKTYLWDFGVSGTTNDTSTQLNGSYSFPDSGTYNISLVANPGWACADTIQKSITIYPKVSAQIPQVKGACLHEANFDFTAGGTFESYAKFSWNFGASGSPNTSTLQNPTNITFPDTGVYQISLSIEQKSCVAFATSSVTVYPGINSNSFLRFKGNCAPMEVFLEDQSSAWTDVHRIWRVDNRVYYDSIVRLTFEEPGEYIISHEAFTTEGCIDTVEPTLKVINVVEGPTAGFGISGTELSIFDPYVEVSDQSIGTTFCRLFFGDEKETGVCDNDHTFSKPGKFKVSQIVSNVNGCTDTSSVYVTVENEFAFFLPNSFTPNSDGVNELFTPIVIGGKSIEFSIFDRWGHEIFYTETLHEGWDGNLDNEHGAAGAGTYFYKVKIKDFVDEFHFFDGNVYLVR